MTMQNVATDLEVQATDLPGEGAGEQPEGKTKEPTTEDWKAKYEAAEAARAKTDNDLKALKGLRLTEAQREEVMAAIRDDIAEVKQTNAALIRALGSNTTEDLPAEIEKLQGQSAQAQANRRFQGRYESLSKQWYAAIQDRDGNPLLDAEKAPELEEAKKLWHMAFTTPAMDAVDRLMLAAESVAAAHTAVKESLRGRHAAETKKGKDAALAAAKKEREERGDLDMELGPEAGGGGGSTKTWAKAQKIKSTSELSDEDYLKMVAG